jgi:hypothetical protein
MNGRDQALPVRGIESLVAQNAPQICVRKGGHLYRSLQTTTSRCYNVEERH